MEKNNVNLVDDELWDYYSGLPNPMWYQHIQELEDEDNDNTEEVKINNG